jgi:two-component system nitrogen regulation sensor histidine kinase NtrY
MKKVLYISLALILLLVLFMPLELRFLQVGEFPQTLIFLLLFNTNLLALGVLVYLVGKGLLELYHGLKKSTLGFKFRAKILLLFVILTLVPALLVYVIASGLASSYLDSIFSAQFTKPLDISMKIATSLYDEEKDRALLMARAALREPLPVGGPYRSYRLTTLPPDATPAIKSALAGGTGNTEVISSPEGDIILAAVPHPEGGVLVVRTVLPKELAGYIEEIRGAHEGFLKLDSWRTPLRINFFLILGFIALTIMFTALLASLRLAKGITEPVGELARATKEVAHGNLDIKLAPSGNDEMALLIDSFNGMVGEIKGGRESLQKAYLESDRRRLTMEGILDNINTGVISLTPSAKVLTINTAACNILGIKAEDVLGKPYEAVLQNITSDEFKKHVRDINVRTIGSVEQEFWVGLGKRKALLRVFIAGLRDEKGTHMGILVVFDELTELARAQRAIAWQEVARRIAHEIKNPLTPIQLSTERMIKKWAEGQDDFAHVFLKSTKTIIKEVESLRRLVDEFSKFGKMPEIMKKSTDVAALVEEVQNLYKPYKEFRLTITAPPELPQADLDPEQIKRALINIIDNARQAMDGNGWVAVKIEPDERTNRLYIEIADTGPGIPEEVREKLFLPYFSTKKDGTGLGLAIVHKIVSEHNGYIRVSDNLPRGSVFTIELPLKEV